MVGFSFNDYVSFSEKLMIVLVMTFSVLVIILFLFPLSSAYPYVNQGQTINQSETYDMESMIGFGEYAGQLAYWDRVYNEGSTVEPTKIINLFDYKPYAIYIDPAVWTAGNWYHYTGEEETAHENTFAFRVRRTQFKNTTTATPTINAVSTSITIVPVTVLSSNSTVVIEIPTAIPTPTVTARILTAAANPVDTVPVLVVPPIPTIKPLPSQVSTIVVSLGIAILLFVLVRKL